MRRTWLLLIPEPLKLGKRKRDVASSGVFSGLKWIRSSCAPCHCWPFCYASGKPCQMAKQTPNWMPVDRIASYHGFHYTQRSQVGFFRASDTSTCACVCVCVSRTKLLSPQKGIDNLANRLVLINNLKCPPSLSIFPSATGFV